MKGVPVASGAGRGKVTDMSTLHFTLASILGVLFALSAAGCEKCQVSSTDGSQTTTKSGYCSVSRFVTNSPRTASQPITAGKNLTIDSRNGRVRVSRGTTGNVDVKFAPFVYRAFNTPLSEIQKNWDQLETTVTADASGNVTVQTIRANGAPSTLGADVDVSIPDAFSGSLTVRQYNGSTELAFVGGATAISVQSDNGSIDARTGAAAQSVNLTTDVGDVSVTIDGFPAGASGGTISTAFGDIALDVPGSATFSAPATAGASGTVDFGTPPSGCTVQTAAANSKTLLCGGATTANAVLTVSATGGSGSVTATYH